MVKQFMNYKVSAMADAVTALISSRMAEKAFTDRKIAVIRHVYQKSILLEFQVHREGVSTHDSYGVRQAWVYVHQQDQSLELHFSDEESMRVLAEEYPNLKNHASLIYTMRVNKGPTHPRADILMVIDILMDYFDGSLESLPDMQ